VTWRVLTTPACEPDFQALSDEDRTAVVDDLFAWIDQGPPRSAPRRVAGAALFDDPLPCGYSVSYFVDETQRYVAVIRLRRTPGAVQAAWAPPAAVWSGGKRPHAATFPAPGAYRVSVAFGTGERGSPYGDQKVVQTTVTVNAAPLP